MTQLKTSKEAPRPTMGWELFDGDRRLAVVEKWEPLKLAILSLSDKAFTPNTIVNLVSPHGDTLSIGIASSRDRDNPQLSAPLACLHFTDRSGDAPYRAVVGDPALSFENGGVVVFRYEEGTWTEVLRRNCVPVDVMLRVVQHFLEIGTLPDWIAWEQV